MRKKAKEKGRKSKREQKKAKERKGKEKKEREGERKRERRNHLFIFVLGVQFLSLGKNGAVWEAQTKSLTMITG